MNFYRKTTLLAVVALLSIGIFTACAGETPAKEEDMQVPKIEMPVVATNSPNIDEITIVGDDVNGEEWLEAAISFIAKHPSLFSIGYERNSGELYSRKMSSEEGLIWFDRYGTRIDTPTFVLPDGSAPIDFRLYDMDGDGIPELVIYYSPLLHGGGWCEIYRFVDGTFRQVIGPMHTINNYYTEEYSVVQLSYIQLFIDNLENTVILIGDDIIGYYGYYFISFDDYMMYFEPFIEFRYQYAYDVYDASNDEYIMYFEQYVYDASNNECIGHMDDVFAHWENFGVEAIFGKPEIELTPLIHFTELEDEIIDFIRTKHGLE